MMNGGCIKIQEEPVEGGGRWGRYLIVINNQWGGCGGGGEGRWEGGGGGGVVGISRY